MLYHWSYCPVKKPTQKGLAFKFHLFMKSMFVAARTKLFCLKLFCVSFRVFCRGVVYLATLTAFESNFDSHLLLSLKAKAVGTAFRFITYARILETTPAPTVRPPSRIAKRVPSSIAIGAISSAVILTLSPGITISVPSGRVIAPVTSVVRT